MRLCEIEDCSNKHLAKGFCRPHWYKYNKYGNPLYVKPNIYTPCEAQECKKTAVNNLYCHKHNLAFLKYGDPLGFRTCEIKGCGLVHHGQGLCNKHHSRLLKHGDPLKIVKGNNVCSIEGCKRKYASKGFCRLHYNRNYYNGDPLSVQRDYFRDELCTVEGCQKEHVGKGLCNMHYRRQYKYGSVDVVLKNPGGKYTHCTLHGCNNKHSGLGMCQKHYIRFKKWGNPYKIADKICKLTKVYIVECEKGCCFKIGVGTDKRIARHRNKGFNSIFETGLMLRDKALEYENQLLIETQSLYVEPTKTCYDKRTGWTEVRKYVI